MKNNWSISEIENNEDLWEYTTDIPQNLKLNGLTPIFGKQQGSRMKILNSATTCLIYRLPWLNIEQISIENCFEVLYKLRMLDIARGMNLSHSLTADDIAMNVGLRVKPHLNQIAFEETLRICLENYTLDTLKKTPI